MSSGHEFVIRHGTVVAPDGIHRLDIRVEGGRVVEMEGSIGQSSSSDIDAEGLIVLPGMLDSHLHFNEPGRTHWEGAGTGSRALSAGGGTMFCDMPLNSTPCTVNAQEVQNKRRALERSSITDFALWGGLTPGSLDNLAAMAEAGVMGFKAFMCDSGLPEFPCVDRTALRDGMQAAAELALPVAVHAESEAITRRLSEALRGSGARDFLASRPVIAECEAVELALTLAGETRVKLHIVHLSSGAALEIAAGAKARGVDVTVETCPHYLYFSESDVERLGVVAKCAPPIRQENGDLWEGVRDGRIDTVASDHSPTEPGMKREGDFKSSWGGIAGVQSSLPVLFDRGYHARKLSLERIAALTATAPALRFGFPRKGAVALGRDADLVLVDAGKSFTLDAAGLHQRHRISPYLGETFRGSVRRTIRRGETIFMDGRITATTNGRFVRPE